ncbi:MAG: response regulator [Anaerolineae bacterium]|nr:response regulator [Anaerolineae bacterium]
MAKILIVDDSSLSRRMLRQALEPLGHQIIEAPEGLTALELYALHQPDLVLLDLTMSGMYGLEVLRKLREMDQEARVIIATADIQNSTRAMVEAAGARGYITKPFAGEQVRNVVSSILSEVEDADN